MRVIAGSARSLKLVTPEGQDTRPTTDRIKETLFNILQFDLYDAAFLDLFAGSGAIGIEALSRGAKEACFVDSGTEAESCIKENLKHTKLEDKATVYKQDVFVALTRMEYQKKFDFVFMDPPYRMTDEPVKLAHQISDKKIMNSGGILMIEHEKSVIMPLTMGYFTQIKHKTYGITAVDFYRWTPSENEKEV